MADDVWGFFRGDKSERGRRLLLLFFCKVGWEVDGSILIISDAALSLAHLQFDLPYRNIALVCFSIHCQLIYSREGRFVTKRLYLYECYMSDSPDLWKQLTIFCLPNFFTMKLVTKRSFFLIFQRYITQ